jgi:hypothetical protein
MGMKVTIDFLLLMEGGDVILTSAVAEENWRNETTDCTV